MLRTVLYQQSMLEVDPDEIGLGADSFERWLPQVVTQFVSLEEFREFYHPSIGAGTRCPLVLTAMLLLQFRYNVSDRELIKRCQRDLGWRYAMGLEKGSKPPSISSFQRFRANVREFKGDDFFFQCSLSQAMKDGLIEDTDLQAIDSTNTECRGAIIDTFNLVALGIGNVVKTVAKCLGEPPQQLAERWELTRYLARSVKGQASIDWSNESERNALLTSEIRDVERLVEQVASLHVTLPQQVDEAIELVQKVAKQDVEQLEDGTYRIAKGTSKGRVISITDPEARHGRKSSSKVINGFKTHVLGTIESQFVVGVAITDASVPDAKPTQKLLEQAQNHELKPHEVVGDAAYGSGANQRASKASGVTVLTKLPSPSHKGAFAKSDFDIDLVSMQVTCPAGVTTDRFTMVKEPSGATDTQVARFCFDKQDCQPCDLKAQCGKATVKRGKRKVTLSIYEEELQQTKAFNSSARAPEVLRSRSSVERLISHLVRMGMRQARFFGMQATQFQAFMVGAAYNLQRYVTLMARRLAPALK